MTRIYIVTHRDTKRTIRHVRAHTLGGAIRAVADEHFTARAASAEDVVQAATAGTLDVLDATAPTQVDIEDTDAADPGPVPLRAAAGA